MFTVLAKLPHNIRPKLYGFARSRDAVLFADKLQAAGIPASLGYDRSISLPGEGQIKTSRNSK